MGTITAIIIKNIRNTVTTIGIRTASSIEEAVDGVTLLEGSMECAVVLFVSVDVDIVDVGILTVGIKYIIEVWLILDLPLVDVIGRITPPFEQQSLVRFK